MDYLHRVSGPVRGRIHRVAAYQMTLYFFEILYLMIALLFMYGKAVSIAVGAALSLLLAVHIVQMYFKKNRNRLIQLFIIDLHAAFAIGYLFGTAARGADADPAAALILATRTLTLAMELPLAFFLSGSATRELFS